MSRTEQRTLEEQIGVSLNASALRMESRAPGGETALLHVAALGMATLAVHLGTDRTDEPVAARRDRIPQRQDVVAGDLSALLWHVRSGGQLELVPRAAGLLAEWLTYRTRFVAVDRQLLAPFAARVLHEWLSDRCVACGGSGKLERSRTGVWIRPRGSMQRNAVFRPCTACHGSRRQPISHVERRKALGVTHSDYEAQGWHQHFAAAFISLQTRLKPRVHRPLTAELERRTRRP